ncbi:Rrf2 family transcriptional regulator [Nonomuraea sp. NPDC052265]|uniref:Rrf2 family transcriptional regulator n=1 Tax=Nonomuraea sp. NPDC052265 TaxID=3364374 RepID=UPI0037C95703
MRLTAFTDISLRIVMRLAVAREEELLTTRAVSGMLAVPYTHAAKAVARLSELGVVEARRGRGGGLQLTAQGRAASVGALAGSIAAFAGALIAMEARIYAEAGAREGGTWRQWRVAERRAETADAVLLVLAPLDGEPVPPALPGQYVSVRVRMPDGVHQLRQYTLSGAGADGLRRITVKRDGEVSALLHDTVRPGDELTLSAPFGEVTLAAGRAPLVFVSAGIGCTPIVAMLEHLAASADDRAVLVLHADRSREGHALRADMERLAGDRSVFWYEEGEGPRTGRMDLTGVRIPEGAVVYMCGPLAFMREARAQLIEAGVAPRDIHYEVFGPDLWLAA